jgi:hypothetical protein
MEYGQTAHNRPVYASGAKAPSGYVLARSFASLIPTPKLRHILPALVFASQSPYSGRQNVVNSRNVMRNKKPKYTKSGGIRAAARETIL